MAHTFESDERKTDGASGFTCTTCKQWFRSHSTSDCPGYTIYWRWDDAHAAGLRTRTQWRGLRRRVASGALPSGVVPQRDKGYWYYLYAEEQTVPMREPSQAQRTVLERGRTTQLTCKRCGRVCEHKSSLNRNRICYVCIDEARYKREQARDKVAHAEATAFARELLAADDWVLIDTETTGLDDPEIIEIAVVAPDGTTLFETRVRPIGEIEQGATYVHGLVAADLLDEPTWREILPDLLDVILGKRLVAYNAAFDADAVYFTNYRHGLRVYAQEEPWTGQMTWVDVMVPYARWWGDWSDYHRGYRWQPLPGGSHGAREDCLATLATLHRMAAEDAERK
jgi:DNA polymerase III epsilon subunit-like protein